MTNFTRSYLVAQAVETLLEITVQNLSNEENCEIVSHPYQNGRENGYSFSFYQKEDPSLFCSLGHYHIFTVAEFRNTDQIVIYPSTRLPMDDQDGSWYEQKHFVPPNRPDLAVKTILALLGKPVGTRMEIS